MFNKGDIVIVSKEKFIEFYKNYNISTYAATEWINHFVNITGNIFIFYNKASDNNKIAMIKSIKDNTIFYIPMSALILRDINNTFIPLHYYV